MEVWWIWGAGVSGCVVSSGLTEDEGVTFGTSALRPLRCPPSPRLPEGEEGGESSSAFAARRARAFKGEGILIA